MFQRLRFPLNVNETIIEPIKSDCTIFSSAMAPFKLAFDGLIGSDPQKLEFIYKSGDDLRQDQLILQMFSLMDSLLKGVNQDYKLIPYKA
jgi:phosphatidylinositol 3-kinase